MSLPGGAVFADLVRALAPYLDDVVFVGGWVQALYVIEAEGSELLAREVLATSILAGLPELAARHPEESAAAGMWLAGAVADGALLKEVAIQVIEGSPFEIEDHAAVRALVKGRLRRLLDEGWGDERFI